MILVANYTLISHLDTLKKVFMTLVENKLELRLEKYSFLCNEIDISDTK